MKRPQSVLAALVFVMFVGGGAGCTDTPASPVSGYLAVSLIAPGANGAIYRLPQGTSLILSRSEAPSFVGEYSLDGDESSLTVEVPPGNYTVDLLGTGGSTWPLTRVNADSSTEIVQATLELTPTISVVEDQTTPLVIRFLVGSLGPITFGHGSVDVSIDVDEVTGALAVVYSASLTAVDVLNGAAAPAELAPRLPQLGTALQYVATMHTVGSWAERAPGGICVPTTTSVEATGHPGFSDLIAESQGSTAGSLCLTQSLGVVELSTGIFRRGSSTTPLLSDLGDREFQISHSIVATFTADVFDGTTLDVAALVGIRASVTQSFAVIRARTPPSSAFETWYFLSASGTGTTGVSPQ